MIKMWVFEGKACDFSKEFHFCLFCVDVSQGDGERGSLTQWGRAKSWESWRACGTLLSAHLGYRPRTLSDQCKEWERDFPGGPMVEHLLANTGDTGWMEDSTCCRVTEPLGPRLLTLCSESLFHNNGSLHTTARAAGPPLAATGEGPHAANKTQHSQNKEKTSSSRAFDRFLKNKTERERTKGLLCLGMWSVNPGQCVHKWAAVSSCICEILSEWGLKLSILTFLCIVTCVFCLSIVWNSQVQSYLKSSISQQALILVHLNSIF